MRVAVRVAIRATARASSIRAVKGYYDDYQKGYNTGCDRVIVRWVPFRVYYTGCQTTIRFAIRVLGVRLRRL